MRKTALFILLTVIAIFSAVWFFYGIKIPETAIAPTISEPEKEKDITLLFTGDIMLDRGVEYMIKTEGKGDFKFPFLRIADELKKADILFGNLESPISDKGTKVGSIYSFKADLKSIEGLIYAGFDILSFANNHVFDYERLAFKDTLERLKIAGIDYVGAGLNATEASSPIIREIDGTKIGFLAFSTLGPESWKATENNSGINLISEKDIEKAKEIIKSAKENADILIVSLHAGEEYKTNPNELQISLAKSFIDAGADLVVGHHPHVIQPTIAYENGWIAFSLGNFVFDQGFSKETMEGTLLKAVIEGKKIKEVILIKIKMNEFFQPQIVDKEE